MSLECHHLPNSVLRIAQLALAFVAVSAHAMAQPIYNPTVEIRPVNDPAPVAPAVPGYMPWVLYPVTLGSQVPSLWIWDYPDASTDRGTPNILLARYEESTTQSQPPRTSKTQWGISTGVEKLSWASSMNDAVLNVEGADLVLANLKEGLGIHLSTTRSAPPGPLVGPPAPYFAYDSVRFTVTHDGQIGINQKTPSAPLEVRSANSSATSSSYNPVLLRLAGKNSITDYGIDFTSSGFFLSNDLSSGPNAKGKIFTFSNSSTLGDYVEIRNGHPNVIADRILMSDLKGISLETNNNQRMVILPDGFVGIGTAGRGTDAYAGSILLGVEGLIKATEIRVSVENWADNVFDPSYSLMPLMELDSTINALGHLPGVPSEGEVKADGIGLSEMSSILLRKVEELTLYLIRQERELESLKAEHARLVRETDTGSRGATNVGR